MAGKARALPHALHTDREFLDEPGLALLRGPGRADCGRAARFATVKQLVDSITAYLVPVTETCICFIFNGLGSFSRDEDRSVLAGFA